MALRPEFNFPSLDAAKVDRLVELASLLDGSGPGQCDDEHREFNKCACTVIPLAEFQGIYGGMEYDSWVRNVLCERIRDCDRLL